MRNEADISGADNARDVTEFCANNRISRAMYYKLQKLGQGPRVMKLGALTRITPEAEAEWRREREAASVKPATAA